MTPMVDILIPDLSWTFLAAALIPLVIGFVVGMILKSAMKVGIAIAALVLILIAVGVITPDQVLKPIISLWKGEGAIATGVHRLAGFLPYSSVTFLIGLAVGFLKG